MLDDRDATVIDVKIGQERPWHRVQVMIYQYALPLSVPQYWNVQIGGVVVYPTHTVRIPRGALPRQFIEDIASLIRRLATDAPPKAGAELGRIPHLRHQRRGVPRARGRNPRDWTGNNRRLLTAVTHHGGVE